MVMGWTTLSWPTWTTLSWPTWTMLWRPTWTTLSWPTWTTLRWPTWTTLSWPAWTCKVEMANMNKVELANMNNVELANMNNVVNNVVQPSDNNVVTTLFSHHCYNNLLTSWNRHVKNSRWTWLFYRCKFFLFPTAMNKLVASPLLNNIAETRMNRILLVQQCCSLMITMLFKHCSGNTLWQLIRFLLVYYSNGDWTCHATMLSSHDKNGVTTLLI